MDYINNCTPSRFVDHICFTQDWPWYINEFLALTLGSEIRQLIMAVIGQVIIGFGIYLYHRAKKKKITPPLSSYGCMAGGTIIASFVLIVSISSGQPYSGKLPTITTEIQ